MLLAGLLLFPAQQSWGRLWLWLSAMPKHIEFCLLLDTFIILCRGQFLPEFLSNFGTMILRFWGGVLELFYVIHHVLPDVSSIFWITVDQCRFNDVNVGRSPMNES